jgi:hypothetical protein
VAARPADSRRPAAVPLEGLKTRDELDVYLTTLPRDLSGSQWAAWRAKHRPPYLLARNRRGELCGLCGTELGVVTQLCAACMGRESAYLRTLTAAPKRPLPARGIGDGRRGSVVSRRKRAAVEGQLELGDEPGVGTAGGAR